MKLTTGLLVGKPSSPVKNQNLATLLGDYASDPHYNYVGSRSHARHICFPYSLQILSRGCAADNHYELQARLYVRVFGVNIALI
jgi:hypothetical protein